MYRLPHTHFISNNYIVILQPQNANRSDNNYIKTVLKSTLKLSPCSRKSSFNSNIKLIIHIDVLTPAILVNIEILRNLALKE